MEILNEILGASDFQTAVADLAREFRQQHRLPALHQLGLVTADVEAAAQALEEKGLGPFVSAAGRPGLWRERGEEKTFRGKMGLAYHQGVQLELLEPGQGSDFYRECLDAEGRVVVQHLGFSVADVDEWAERMSASGFPVRVRGRLAAGPLSVDYAYMDTMAATGLVIEFISWRLLGLRFAPPAFLIHALGRLEKWTGRRSLSV